MTDLTSWLASLDAAGLERVLSYRPDATMGSIPRNLGELAQRLGHPHSVALVLDAAPLPLRQVIEALLSLSEPRTEAALRDLLERHEPDHDDAVAFTLEGLYDYALAWPAADGGIALAAGLAQVFPRPLGLGPPLRAMVGQMNATSLRRALTHLGDPHPPSRRDDAAAALQKRLADPVAVRAIVAAAPAPIVEYLRALAGVRNAGADGFDGDGLNDGGLNDGGFDGGGFDEDSLDDALDAADFDSPNFEYGQYFQRYEAVMWASERGLLSGNAIGADLYLPAEVALALRGTTYRAPFTPYPPPIPAMTADPAAVESGAAAAATDFAGQAVAVLDLIARAPLTQLKSGGVGARELTRVAKTAGIDEAAARLAIELAAELGLLAMDLGFLRTTETFALWRELDPAAAYAVLLHAWRQLPFTPTATIDFDGRTIRLLHRHGADDGAETARDVLLTVLASLPPGRGTTRAGLAPALLWSRPRRRALPQDRTAPYATVWSEAERLGVIAAGALSRIGRALDDGAGDELVAALRTMLPASSDSARFGSDLTVLVAGSPSARVSSLLDSAADRESRGAGVTWRFSPASVRRALDDGVDPVGLVAALEAIAVGELPQPLRYLINDVARRHGELRVSAARTVIRGEDPALLAQVAADRTLRGFGLRLVAPTVLTSNKSEVDTLVALRAAGYLPVPEPHDPPAEPGPSASASGSVFAARTQPSPRRAVAARAAVTGTDGHRAGTPGGAPVSLVALATHLLATDPVSDTEPIGAPSAASRGDAGDPATELVLGRLNPRLTADELHQLAYAIETGGPVAITYESTSGARTHRIIGDAKLGGGMLDAWCYLRNDERYFLVDRIHSVAPGSP